MGLEIKTNKKGEYSLKSSISDESYHPESKWITQDEAKKLLIERAFYKFVEQAIEIDMTFPNRYYVNDKYHHDDSIPNFHEWYLGILKDEEYGKKLFEKFNEVLKKHDLNLDTSTEDITLKEKAEAYTNKTLNYDSTPSDSNKSEIYEWVMNAYIAGTKTK